MKLCWYDLIYNFLVNVTPGKGLLHEDITNTVVSITVVTRFIINISMNINKRHTKHRVIFQNYGFCSTPGVDNLGFIWKNLSEIMFSNFIWHFKFNRFLFHRHWWYFCRHNARSDYKIEILVCMMWFSGYQDDFINQFIVCGC